MTEEKEKLKEESIIRFKTDIVSVINSLVDDTTKAIQKLLLSSNLYYGRIATLSKWKAPENGKFKQTNKELLERSQDGVIVDLFYERCYHRDQQPMKIQKLFTNEELQTYYDKTQKEKEELENSSEYKEYLRLKQKYEHPIRIVSLDSMEK